MKFEDLSPEIKNKAAQCETSEDLINLAQEEGIELSDEQIEAISGGWGGCDDNQCGVPFWR